MCRSFVSICAWGLILMILPVAGRPPAPVSSCKVSAGTRSITVPFPAGFVRCDGVDEDFDTRLLSFVAVKNRLLAWFTTPEDLEKIKSQSGELGDRSFNMQVVRELEHDELGEQTFRGYRDQLKAGIEKSAGSMQDQIQQLVAEGKEKLKKGGVESSLSLTGTAYLGVFEESDTSLGFTMAMKTKQPGEDGQEVVSRSLAAVVMAPVNGRLLYLCANYPYQSEADRQEAQQAVLAWRDAVVAANPRVQGPKVGSRAEKIGAAAGALAGIGVVIAVIVVVSKKRAARKSAPPPPPPPPLPPFSPQV